MIMPSEKSMVPGAGIALRVSVTEACQFRCLYCRPAAGGCEGPGPVALSADALIAIIRRIHRAAPIHKLRFTGGEPLLRRDLPALVAGCVALGIGEVALTTNGQRLAACIGPLRAAGLRRLNVSLDALDPATFRRMSRGGDLERTLRGIEAALDQGFRPIKLNTVVLRGENDAELERLAAFALRHGCHIRFLELMPIGVGQAIFEQRHVPWHEVFDRLSRHYRLMPETPVNGSTSRDYRLTDACGRSTVCGFISPVTAPFCEGCNRLRLGADGRLFGCLAVPRSIDLTRLGRGGESATTACAAAVREALAMKTERHRFEDQRAMVRLGG